MANFIIELSVAEAQGFFLDFQSQFLAVVYWTDTGVADNDRAFFLILLDDFLHIFLLALLL